MVVITAGHVVIPNSVLPYFWPFPTNHIPDTGEFPIAFYPVSGPFLPITYRTLAIITSDPSPLDGQSIEPSTANYHR